MRLASLTNWIFHAAELMGISQRALSHYLAKYGLADSSEQSVSEEGRS